LLSRFADRRRGWPALQQETHRARHRCNHYVDGEFVGWSDRCSARGRRERCESFDAADFYGLHVTNQIIRKALSRYPDNLVIVSKLGAARPKDGSWVPAFSRQDLTAAVHDNLRNLGLDVLDVVNLCSMFGIHEPVEGSIEGPLTVLAELQQKGLVRHIGLSNVTAAQIAEARQIAPIVCVQNMYNLVQRTDDALIDDLARDGIA
jgi:pyridoxine 4-dehydrogenase